MIYEESLPEKLIKAEHVIAFLIGMLIGVTLFFMIVLGVIRNWW